MHKSLPRLLATLTLLALPLAAQQEEPVLAGPDAELERQLAPLKAEAEKGDAHATQQVYMRYGVAGHIEQARAWSARFNSILAQQAEAGDTRAMQLLAARYMAGNDYTPQDLEKAVTWYSRAAEAGEAAAAYILGDVFARQGNEPMARKAFEQAYSLYSARTAAGTDHEALYCLGYMEQNGIGIPRNTATGIAKLVQAADMGSPWATAQLFKTYLEGIGAPRDEAKAISYARKAADEHRDGTMAYVAATAYLMGKGVEQDIALGERYLDQAAALSIPDAIYMKANRLENAGKLAEALPFYRQAASMHQREALTRYGALLLHGAEGVDPDEPTAISLLNTAASRYDSPQAAWELSRYYATADETELADSWCCVAADRGVAQAMARRGLLHLIPGSCVDWSPTQAYRWWRLGKQAGDSTCTLYIRLFLYLFIPCILIIAFGLPLYLRKRLERRSAQ